MASGTGPSPRLEAAEAAREIAVSKLRLEERLGRPVEAYAFVKGSLADYRPEHVSLVQQAGYTLGFTSVSGRTARRPTAIAFGATTSSRTREDVRACPRGRVRPDLREGHGSGHVRAARLQQGPRHRDPVSLETVRYTPEWRASLVALLARVGTTQLSDEEFAWWFDHNPRARGSCRWPSTSGEVVGVAAMSFFKTRLDGVETRLAIPVNVATDARYRGRGVFSTLQQRTRRLPPRRARRSP